MVQHHSLQLPPFPRGFHLITDRLIEAVPDWPAQGLFHAHILHTSAGLTVNENADPSVRIDYETIFNRLVPENDPAYTHTMEGPDDMPAHVKASLVGHAVSLPIVDGRLLLGTWQGIYLCEFRNRGGGRRLLLSVYA
jgi:secondary thiamine-phosphate synthase enzyme